MSIPVSVILPAYNAGPYIAEAILSILNQTYTDFELIIINDCSTDNTEEVIQSILDPRIIYIKNEQNSGLIFNLNLGISLAKGKYIVRMDADDISLPTRIAEQIAFMDANPSVGICGSWFEYYGDINGISCYESQDNDIKLQMLYNCSLCHPTVVMRRDVLIDNSLLYSKDYLHAEDYDLFVRISYVSKMSNIPKVLLRYRKHTQSVSYKYNNIQLNNSYRIIQNLFNHIGFKITLDKIPVWLKFCSAEFDLTLVEMKEVDNICYLLINSNNTSNYIKPDKLKLFLANKWYNLLYNNIKNNITYNFLLSSKTGKFIPLKNRIKFYLNALYHSTFR